MGILYVVGTPIGNLGDTGTRALNILSEVDFIYCEDTRVTKKLLNRYGIKNNLKSFHARSNNKKIIEAVNLLKKGKDIALVSDAGTPTISDPGSRLVSTAQESNIQIISIPGPSALIAALSISGLPSSDFLFLGFLPHKKGRKTLVKEIADTERTVVLYESPHRFLKLLNELEEVLSKDRKIVIARELTKIHEETIWGNIQDIQEHFRNNPDTVKGEFVVLIGA